MGRLVATAAAFVFACCVARWVWRVLVDLFVLGVVPYVPALQHNFKRHGPWAVVTGSSGIPEGYARQLAARGINILFLARREQVVAECVRRLKKEFSVESCYALQDFSEQQDAKQVEAKLQDALRPFLPANCRDTSDPLDMVGTVVNSIGMADDDEWRAGWSGAPDPARLAALVMNANFHSYALTLGIFLPRFRARTATGGVAINIASVCSHMAYPSVSYATSKAALRTFCAALRGEFQHYNRNVIVQTVNPCLVHTALTSNFLDSGRMFGVWPYHYTQKAIATVGWVDETSGNLYHAFQTYGVLAVRTLLHDRLWHAILGVFVKRVSATTEKRPQVTVAATASNTDTRESLSSS